jgi:hypothetical protein
MIILILFAILLVSFVLFKVISKRIARRKRREAEAEEEGPCLPLEEGTRFDLQESMANMVKEHPEDAARLISMLILEEPDLATHKKANGLIKILKMTGDTDKARELLEKTLGSQKAIDLINLLTRNAQEWQLTAARASSSLVISLIVVSPMGASVA